MLFFSFIHIYITIYNEIMREKVKKKNGKDNTGNENAKIRNPVNMVRILQRSFLSVIHSKDILFRQILLALSLQMTILISL